MNSLFGAGIGLGAWLLTRLPERATSARGLALGVALTGLGAVVYIGTTDLRIIAVGALLWGAVIGAVEPLLRTLMQLDAPEEYVGRVMGTAQLHRSAGELVPLAVAPGLAALFGVQAVMIGGGLIASVIALATIGHASSIDRAGHRPHGRVSAEQAMPRDEPISPIT
jgi:MFS family permease